MQKRLPLGLALVLLAACNNAPPAPKPDTVKSASPTAAKSAAPKDPDGPPPRTSQPGDLPAPSDVAKAPSDAEKTSTGLATKVIAKGTGQKKPGPKDRVKVHYVGWQTNGVMFDASILRGEPAQFEVGGVIPGWTEALQLMVVNEKRRVWIPSALAYGDKPARPGAPSGDLTFEIELLDIAEAPKEPAAPPDVKEPPKDAKKTSSGLRYKVLKAGKGKDSPKATDWVTVHYTGWTTDGKMFDSSVVRGEPAKFMLQRVIKGWTEGVQLMKVGEKTRFWIPGDLAYGDKPTRPGAPAGMLVFDIELIAATDKPQ